MLKLVILGFRPFFLFYFVLKWIFSFLFFSFWAGGGDCLVKVGKRMGMSGQREEEERGEHADAAISLLNHAHVPAAAPPIYCGCHGWALSPLFGVTGHKGLAFSYLGWSRCRSCWHFQNLPQMSPMVRIWSIPTPTLFLF